MSLIFAKLSQKGFLLEKEQDQIWYWHLIIKIEVSKAGQKLRYMYLWCRLKNCVVSRFSIGMHNDLKSYTGVIMSDGKKAIQEINKRKVNCVLKKKKISLKFGVPSKSKTD